MKLLSRRIWGGKKMLKVKDVHAYYGPIEALKGIDIEVNDSSIVCQIGSNGAGKTT